MYREQQKELFSKQTKRQIKKYLDGVKCESIKHANLATAVRAFIGAVFNCCGPVAASKIMEKFKLTNDA